MALRNFIDSTGRGWRVWSVVPQYGWGRDDDTFTPGLEGGWLCFEHAEEKRRLSPIPDGWEEADAEAMEGYLQRAAPVPRRANV
jgi:hypothetical protein